jgi:hypothetical protein
VKKLILIFVISGLTLKSKAQTYIVLEDTSSVYAKVDVDPAFPGGFQMFDRYIDDNSVKVLKPNHAVGVIVAGFILDKNGKITRPKIIRGLTPETDSAAVYLLKNSPLWKPGFKKGAPVTTYVKIAVKFIYSGNLRPVHVQDVVLSKGHDADITIDEPVGTSPERNDDSPDKIYTSVEQVPEFPGGIEKFKLYVKNNLVMPQNANGITGRVIVTFVVERDGSLTGLNVVRGLSTDIDKEVIRLLKQSPKWHPGIRNGKPVRVAYTVPIQVHSNQ